GHLAAVSHDDRGRSGREDLVEVARDLLVGLALRPGKFGSAEDLQPGGVDQVEVADEVGRPDLLVTHRQARIEAPADVGQVQAFAMSLIQPRYAGLPHRRPRSGTSDGYEPRPVRSAALRGI